MKTHLLIVLLFLSVVVLAQMDEPGLQAAVNAGNQAWIDGMKTGNAAMIASTYAPDAINCFAEGTCVTGVANIENQMRARLSNVRARNANVMSASVVRDRDLAYEWGYAEATMTNGQPIRGRYITVWARQPGGGWKIIRNMALPADRGGRDFDRGPRESEQGFPIRCESDDMGRHSCSAPVQIARAVMTRQVSGSPCTQGQTWGWQGSNIWVDRGCRAEFTVYGYGSSNRDVTEYNDSRTDSSLRCESNDEHYRMCSTTRPLRGARLVRQISGSACTEGQSWGWKQEGIWVDRGCRAEFELTFR